MVEGYKELLNSINLHKHYKEVAESEYKYNQTLYHKHFSLADKRAIVTLKPLDRVVEDLNKYESMIYLEDENIKYLEEQKKAIDECINQSDITVKVAQLRAMGLTQEQVSELVDRTPRQVQNIEKKIREGY